MLYPVPNPTSLPTFAPLSAKTSPLVPANNCNLPSGFTAPAFILKIRYKEYLQEPSIKSMQEIIPEVACPLELFERDAQDRETDRFCPGANLASPAFTKL